MNYTVTVNDSHAQGAARDTARPCRSLPHAADVFQQIVSEYRADGVKVVVEVRRGRILNIDGTVRGVVELKAVSE